MHVCIFCSNLIGQAPYGILVSTAKYPMCPCGHRRQSLHRFDICSGHGIFASMLYRALVVGKGFISKTCQCPNKSYLVNCNFSRACCRSWSKRPKPTAENRWARHVPPSSTWAQCWAPSRRTTRAAFTLTGAQRYWRVELKPWSNMNSFLISFHWSEVPIYFFWRWALMQWKRFFFDEGLKIKPSLI